MDIIVCIAVCIFVAFIVFDLFVVFLIFFLSVSAGIVSGGVTVIVLCINIFVAL